MTAVADELAWLSLRELSALLTAGELSATQTVSAHVERVARLNPALNAVVTWEPETALASARAVDDARAAGVPLGPLAGVPMTHKDTHEVAGMRTTWGSPIRAHHVSERDCLVVARLRAAGVIATGKTNVPEFAAGAHTFNPLFGTTVNPYDPTRSAAGSSGGAAAVIAAGIQPAGDGSDTGGSLRLPASFTNLVGLRPTDGWLPHAIPENPWEWLSQDGFMARSVSDVALLMELCSGPAALAPQSRCEPGGFTGPAFDADADWEPELRTLRVGFAPDLGGRIEVEAEVAEIVGSAAQVFDDLGARVAWEAPDLTAAAGVFRVARAFEFGFNYGSLLDAHAQQLKPALRANIQAGLDLSRADIFDALRERAQLLTAMGDFFARCDVLVTVTSQVLPFDSDLEYPAELNGARVTDYLAWMEATTLISATGCPAVSVPAGFSAAGLPVGLQIVGRPGVDAQVLRVARAFELATGWGQRRPELAV
ncbi:amidase [Brevibacterium sp. 5221]|uniref:Amidase n=1 Tax=Brevibacterium rongguiense TaxID=2695267 RepID=A0A6N9H4C4_9MICO|nr:amidase family protein [Brevibacterium rongguiense]MYM18532.1 amidase [Brevibacterium rongguiense]